MHVIGITGGVGAGKSTVLNFIRDNYNSRILMADDIAHDLMEPDMPCSIAIGNEFPDVLDEERRIKKERLAQLIFNDEMNRLKVNSIVHPAVKRAILSVVEDEKKKDELDLLIVEAALLLDDNYEEFCDEVWYIHSSEDTRRSRLKENRGYSDEKIDGIFRSQLPESVFRSRCNETVENDGSIENTQDQVRELLKHYGGDRRMLQENEGRQYVYGLDIGTRNVVGTVGYREDDEKTFNVVAMCVKEHETRAMLDGQIHDINKVGKTVAAVTKELSNMLGQPLTEVCIAAAGRVLKTVTTTIEMEFEEEQVVSTEDIHTLDLLGIEKAYNQLRETNDTKFKFYCVGYTVMKYYLNEDIISNLEGHKAEKIGADIIVTFLPEDVVDGLYTAVDRANLKVLNLTLEPIAAINVAIPESFRMLNLALVDVGAGTSDICVTKGGSIIAYGMIPLAGDEITELLVQHYLVDFNTAEQIKIAAGNGGQIEYKDIMCISHTIDAEEVWEVTKSTVNKIAEDVAEKIMELNGASPVSAVFIVGGGGKIKGFASKIAEELGIPQERVALRGEEVLGAVNFPSEEIKRDPLLVTPVGICLNYYEQKNSFIFVYFNGERLKLYNNDHLTVVDAALEAGLTNEELFPRRGQEINFYVNDKQRFVRGEAGEPAIILVNGKEANLNTPIDNNYEIEITPSTGGVDAEYTIEQIDEYDSTISFTVNGQHITCPRFAEVNGELQPPSYSIQNGDVINMLNYYTVEQIIGFMDVQVDLDSVIYVNNMPVDLNEQVYENFTVDFMIREETVTSEGGEVQETAADSENNGAEAQNEENQETGSVQGMNGSEVWQPGGDNRVNGINVRINGLEYNMTGKLVFTFVDIFDYIQFNLAESRGRAVVTRINGVECGYADPLKNGDEVYVGWSEE